MTVPAPLWGPDRPPVPARGTMPPFIIEQRQVPGGGVLVTWSLPGLRRLTVHVPEASWLAGEHLPIGTLATQMLASLLPAPPTQPGEQHHNSQADIDD